MRTQYVAVDGISLTYRILSDEGPTLLQVPGAMVFHEDLTARS